MAQTVVVGLLIQAQQVDELLLLRKLAAMTRLLLPVSLNLKYLILLVFNILINTLVGELNEESIKITV